MESGVGNFTGSLLDEMRERWGSSCRPTRACDRYIDVEVRYNVLRNPRSEVLPPLGASDKAVLSDDISEAEIFQYK